MLTIAPPQQHVQYHPLRKHANSLGPTVPRHISDRFIDEQERALKQGSSLGGMTTSHRGLPPPGSFADSVRAPIPPPLQSQPHQATHGYAPIPPQPQPSYGPTRSEGDGERDAPGYYIVKAEEHKMHQEEERTRQQQLRLEQRKIEHDMMRDAIRGGVPAHLIPSIFTSIGGGYPVVSPVQHFQGPLEYGPGPRGARGSPPELRRETRPVSSHPMYYPAPGSAIPQSAISQQQPPPFNASAVYPSPANQSPRVHRSATISGHPPGTSVLKHPINSSLPRLTTNEAQVQQAPSGPNTYGAERASPSPSVTFHHWQPPNTSGTGRGGDTQKTSPRQPTTMSSGESVAINSPRKRKDPRPHQPPPPPSYIPRERERSPMLERPASSHGGRITTHARNNSASQFRARAYDPIGRTQRPQTADTSTPRRQSPDIETRKPDQARASSQGPQAPESGKTEAST
jgi:hypothetical protein